MCGGLLHVARRGHFFLLSLVLHADVVVVLVVVLLVAVVVVVFLVVLVFVVFVVVVLVVINIARSNFCIRALNRTVADGRRCAFWFSPAK